MSRYATLTVNQLIDLELWEKVCELNGYSVWALNEGLIDEDEPITFDTKLELKYDEET